VDGLARISAPKGLMDYVQHLLWNSGDFGRSVCQRGWRQPEVWALAPSDQPPSDTTAAPSANAWMDEWLIAQGKLAYRFCLVAQDLLAAPFDAEAPHAKTPGRWDARGEGSYLVVAKAELGPGVVEAVTGWMISDQFILYVVEDDWPFDKLRPLSELAEKVRHVIVAVSEGESYGIISGS
jgi:hypothetical protein